MDGIANGFKEVIGVEQSFATSIGLRTEAIVAQFGAPRSHDFFVALQPGSTERIVESLKSLNPRAMLWAPRYGEDVVLDEIYSVFPYLKEDGRFEMAPLNDPRFPNMRHLFHNAKKNLSGMSWIKPLINVKAFTDLTAQLPGDSKRDASLLITSNMLQVALSQFNLINTANAVGALAGINDADITLSTLQLHHAAGQTLGMVMAVARHSQLALASDVFNAQSALETLNRERCSAMVAFPHEWHAIAQLPQFATSKPAHLKKGVIVTSPSTPVDAATVESLKAAFGLETCVVTVGIDETSGVFLANGKPLPNTEIKIVDSAGKVAATGTRGHLLVKGANVMNGYRNSSEATKKALDSEKWLRTGVTASVDSNGVVLL